MPRVRLLRFYKRRFFVLNVSILQIKIEILKGADAPRLCGGQFDISAPSIAFLRERDAVGAVGRGVLCCR